MNPITIANKLKTLRNLKGLTPEQVAKKAELNLNDYKALESGKTAVSEEKLTKACDALGIDAKEWFETDGSNVFINNENEKVVNNCENCYFYERNYQDMEMLKSLSKAMATILEKVNGEVIFRDVEKLLIKYSDKLDDKK